MWKFVFYKECLKIRWFLFAYTLLGFLVVGYIFLAFRHRIEFSNARSVMSAMLFQNFIFFEALRYVPLVGGFVVATTQYLPEVVNKRLKLSFHLPVRENRLLMTMQAFGTLSLVVSFFLIFGLFLGFCLVLFPVQLVGVIIQTVLPWILAGFCTYFFCGLVILEPKWMYRFLYAIPGGAFLAVFFQPVAMGAYGPANPLLLFIALVLSVSVLFSGYRFRKGEM